MRSPLNMWLILFVVASIVVAAVPYAGHLVRGGMDQWYFLVIFGAWLLAGWAVIGSGILAFMLRKRSPALLPLMIVFGLLLLLAVVGGFGGVRYAFIELVAG